MLTSTTRASLPGVVVPGGTAIPEDSKVGLPGLEQTSSLI